MSEFDLKKLNDFEQKLKDAVIDLLNYTNSNGFEHSFSADHYSSITLKVKAQDI